jgi:hypothetical protein
MNKNASHAFVNQLLIYTLVMICCSGTVGLGTVWLRHEISLTANRTRQLEASIVEVERHLAETKTFVEAEQDSDVLMRRNSEMHLGLVLPREENQVFRVPESEDVENRLIGKNNRAVLNDASPQFVVSLPRGS